MKPYIPILISAFIAACCVGIAVSWIFPHTRMGYFSTPHPPLAPVTSNPSQPQQ